nr:hypothetical protein [Tanacetum cinerariifolium]
MALKAKLRNLKLGDLSIDGLEGLPSTYETIYTVIVSREPFPDLKMVRSLLTTHEMRLKSWVQNPLVDATSASPMVLLAKSNTSARRGPSLKKPTYVSPQLLPGSFGGVQYGNGWVIPTVGLVSDGVTAAGGLLSTSGGSDAFWSTAGGSPCTGPSQLPVQFTTGVQKQ